MTILGELQSDFCKNLTEFYQISLKNLLYLTDFSSQLMARMHLTFSNKSFEPFGSAVKDNDDKIETFGFLKYGCDIKNMLLVLSLNIDAENVNIWQTTNTILF